MITDISPLNQGAGKATYWIKEAAGMPQAAGVLRLVAIDEAGDVTRLPIRAEWDDAAMTQAEAVEQHLAGAIKQADADLERRRREKPAEPEPREPAPDRPTQRWLADAD